MKRAWQLAPSSEIFFWKKIKKEQGCRLSRGGGFDRAWEMVGQDVERVFAFVGQRDELAFYWSRPGQCGWTGQVLVASRASISGRPNAEWHPIAQ